MIALLVPLHEVILAACMTAVTLAILGTTLLILNRAAPPRHAMHGPLLPRPGVACADAAVLQSWFGALQVAPALRPARTYAPACATDGIAGRMVQPLDGGRPEQRTAERRRGERRA